MEGGTGRTALARWCKSLKPAQLLRLSTLQYIILYISESRTTLNALPDELSAILICLSGAKSIPFVAAVPTPKLSFNLVVPDTFNDDNNVVALFKCVVPDTFNVPRIDELFDNVANPDIFNDDNNVVLLFNVVVPETFKVDINVVELFKRVGPDTFNDDIKVTLL